jgi:Protein of unknown function (DUF3108)
MSKPLNATFAAVAVLCLSAAAAYWLYGRGAAGASPTKALSAAVPPASSLPGNPSSLPAGTTGEVPPSPSATAAAPTSAAEPDPGPFRAGEVLEYAADVAKLSAVADLRLKIVEHRNFFGKNAYHLQAFARTENPLRMMFELDDQFDSYSDAGSLTSLQYEMHLSERGQKVDLVQRMTTGKDPASAGVTQAIVLPGTRDPLGLMQYLRTVDWSKTREVTGPVYDGHKLYDVKSTLASASTPVVVPAGHFDATKVEIRVFQNGAELSDAHFFAYIAHDVARTPVLLEAVMPFATARVVLTAKK